MQTKSFFIFSVIVIAIISIITSYISVLYLTKPVLMGTTGEIRMDYLTGGTLNVIVVDVIGATTINTVNFGSVAKGTNVYTDLLTATTASPWPFILNNSGNNDADVCLHIDKRFLTHALSGAWIGVNISKPIAGSIFATAQDCGASTAAERGGTCYLSSTYQSSATCLGNPTWATTGCLNLWTVIPPANPLKIINSLYAMSTEHKSQAVLQVLLTISADEPSATKSGIITITGKDVGVSCA